jgi:hypothetical protein
MSVLKRLGARTTMEMVCCFLQLINAQTSLGVMYPFSNLWYQVVGLKYSELIEMWFEA